MNDKDGSEGIITFQMEGRRTIREVGGFRGDVPPCVNPSIG